MLCLCALNIMDYSVVQDVEIHQMFGKVVRKRPKLESHNTTIVRTPKPNIIRHTLVVNPNPPREPKKEKVDTENKNTTYLSIYL